MSEYQYYEFHAVDHRLDDAALNTLRAISTRARITPTSFVNDYQWGDLKADPRSLTERYFDAFLYTANWGTRRLIFRVPARLLDLRTAEEYCFTDLASAWTNRKNVLVELWRDGDGEDWEDDLGEGRLASIIPVRADLAGGDLRLLYLGWLLSVQSGAVEDDTPEPPVPPGLGRLTGPLSAAADFLRLDPDLVAAAAEASDNTTAGAVPTAELATRVARLPAAQKNDLLVRLLDGDTHLRTELLRRLTGPAITPATGDSRRTAAELLDGARRHRQEREHLTAQRHRREQRRREREAAAARENRLNQLAREGEHAWQRVTALVATMKPRDYDTAVHLLGDLRDLASQDGTRQTFDERVLQLRRQYPNRHALLRRLDAADLPSN